MKNSLLSGRKKRLTGDQFILMVVSFASQSDHKSSAATFLLASILGRRKGGGV